MTTVQLASSALHGLTLVARGSGSSADVGGGGGDSGGLLLFVLVPLLVGVLFGWVARRPAFGAAVTAVGVVGFAVTWWLATSDVIIQSGDDGPFDSLADALLTVIVFGSLFLGFGVVGLVGLGALGGSFLRTMAAGPTAEDASRAGPTGDEPSADRAGPPAPGGR